MGTSRLSVLVVGAGLAGLSAALHLIKLGIPVQVFEAQSRVGGRVLTIRDAFASGQHAEAGGDFIDEGQDDIIALAREHDLTLKPILATGFAFVPAAETGAARAQASFRPAAWDRVAKLAEPLIEQYRKEDRRWDRACARAVAGRSVAQWLDDVGADSEIRAFARGLRGFFLADPEDLSLLPLIDQLASDAQGAQRMYRIEGGNDRLPLAMAKGLGDRLRMGWAVVAARQDRSSVRLTIENRLGERSHVKGQYVIFAVPATLLRRIRLEPALPAQQARAIERLKYGRVTKSLLQFDRRFWKRKGRPAAFGSDAPIGAGWDANEEQPGPAGVFTLMAGGQSSEACQSLVAEEGVQGLVERLRWLGSEGAELLHARFVTWESDPWVEGGYAYVDPGFDPLLRDELARPRERFFFAGEHTSAVWQGYMNGAVESGIRAANEVALQVKGRG